MSDYLIPMATGAMGGIDENPAVSAEIIATTGMKEDTGSVVVASDTNSVRFSGFTDSASCICTDYFSTFIRIISRHDLQLDGGHSLEDEQQH